MNPTQIKWNIIEMLEKIAHLKLQPDVKEDHHLKAALELALDHLEDARMRAVQLQAKKEDKPSRTEIPWPSCGRGECS